MAAEELLMQQVAAPVDYNLNPIFDYAPLFGWPLWIWIFIAFGMVLLIINLKWLRRRFIMAPTLPYLAALKGGTQEDQQAWMISKNKSFEIKHLRYNADGVISYFDYIKNISMWFLTSPFAVGHAGGIKNVILSDNFDQARDLIAEAAFYIGIGIYNERHKTPATVDGKNLLDEEGKQIYKLPIFDYKSWVEHRENVIKEFPLGIPIDSFLHIDPTKIIQFFPPNRTAGMFGGDNIREARKKNIERKTPSNWIKFAPLGAAIALGIISILIVYMFTHG